VQKKGSIGLTHVSTEDVPAAKFRKTNEEISSPNSRGGLALAECNLGPQPSGREVRDTMKIKQIHQSSLLSVIKKKRQREMRRLL